MDRIKYEVFFSNSGWYAHAHCDCGSTMSSGESFANISDAIGECCDGMTEHIRKNESKKCGYNSRSNKSAVVKYPVSEQEISDQHKENMKSCIYEMRVGIESVKKCLAEAELIETDLVIASKLPPEHAAKIVDLIPDRVIAVHDKLAAVLA